MREVDIYDFDHTVFSLDSGSLFYLYCLVHNPWIIVLLPFQLITGLFYVLHFYDLTREKSFFFQYIRLINLEKNVRGFWDRHEKDIFPWFKTEKRERPAVIISASPEFLLREICNRLGVEHLIATRHDPKTAVLIGRNCKIEEKVRRFQEEFGDCRVVCVYSDDLKNDRPIFALGERCFRVLKNGERQEFRFDEVYKN